MTTSQVVNPATEEVLRTVDLLDVGAVDDAVARAAAAQRAWARLAPAERAAALRAFAAVVDAHIDELAALEVANSGHPIGQAEWEAGHVRDVLQFYAAAPERLSGKQIPVAGGLDVTFNEPLGVVGVIAPWNYPVNLALIPLATAIAAGNHVYLKPSEHTPRTSAFLRELLAEVFSTDRVAVATGGADLGAAFAALPFDHLVFTGSTAVGRKVMAAAAPHLTPLTLELGGKSPALVCDDYPVEKAAARIATGKWFNCGQTCIAPDYVLVPAGKRDAFVEALRREIQARYGHDLGNRDDYTRIINDGQYARLQGYLDDARQRGVDIVTLAGSADPAQRLLPPTVLLEPGDDAKIMQDEIFGPLLPVKSYRTLDEAIGYINGHDRPLALYPFSHDRATVEKVLHATLAGGVSVNDTLFHFAVPTLPFGGVGASGMGAYHSRAGFDAMSKLLPVLWQARRTGGDLLKPPYSKAKWLIDLIVR